MVLLGTSMIMSVSVFAFPLKFVVSQCASNCASLDSIRVQVCLFTLPTGTFENCLCEQGHIYCEDDRLVVTASQLFGHYLLSVTR